MIQLICLCCGELFNKEIGPGCVPKYCSARCRNIQNGKLKPWDRSPRECKTCGKKYTPVNKKQNFCCLSCNHKNVNKKYKPVKIETTTCHVCGKDFLPKINIKGLRICSAYCKSKKYRESEKGKAQRAKNDRAKNHVRRARIRKATFEPVDLMEIYTRDNWVCGLCGVEINKDTKWPDPGSPSIDHIIPLSKGGHHIKANLQSAHLSCNMGKGNRV